MNITLVLSFKSFFCIIVFLNVEKTNLLSRHTFVSSVQKQNIKFNFGLTDLFCLDEVAVRGQKASVPVVLILFLRFYDYA